MCIINQLIKIGVDRKFNTKQVSMVQVGGIKGDIQVYTYIAFCMEECNFIIDSMFIP